MNIFNGSFGIHSSILEKDFFGVDCMDSTSSLQKFRCVNYVLFFIEGMKIANLDRHGRFAVTIRASQGHVSMLLP